MFALTLLLLLLLVFFSCLFSASETSITAANPAIIKKNSIEKDIKSEILLKFKSDKERVLSAILLGNTIANILASSLATFLSVTLLGSAGVLVATLLMTIVILVFAEILPKTYAIQNPEYTARLLCLFVYTFSKLLAPLVYCFNCLIGFLLPKLPSSNDCQEQLPPSEILRNTIMLYSYKDGNLKKSLDFIRNLLDITEVSIDKIMTHRRYVFSLGLDLTKDQLVEAVKSCSYSKVPVWENDKEQIVGILNVAKIECDIEAEKKIEIKNYIEKPVFVPDMTLISVQLHNFKSEKSDFAVVIDEYGNVVGILTLSDILEELLGEAIYTHNYKGIKKLKDGSYKVNGKIPVRDFNKKMGFDFETKYNQTFAGMIIDEIERIPEEGEYIDINKYKIEILERSNNQIAWIRIIVAKKVICD